MKIFSFFKVSLVQDDDESEEMVATNHTGNADTSIQVMRRYDVWTTLS